MQFNVQLFDLPLIVFILSILLNQLFIPPYFWCVMAVSVESFANDTFNILCDSINEYVSLSLH